MEYVDGGDLASFIGTNLPPVEIARMIRQIASALNAVHQSGVIHRDVKPENILLTRDRVPKLTDFGTALLIGGPRITTEGNVLGSIPYLSPEYVERQQLDVRSDIYALGVVAYELVTGKIPFEGEGLVGVINLKLLGEPPGIRAMRPDMPESLEAAIRKLLARLPENRFQTALAVEEEFRLLEIEYNPH
jgi:serine/threonine-protein kinase